MSHGALGAAVNQDQPISTLIREGEAQRLGDGRLGLLRSDLSGCFRSKTNSGVLREATSPAREAHGPHGFVASFSSMAYWRLLRRVDASGPPHSHGMKPGPTMRKFCEAHRALVWIYRRGWAALSIVS